MRAPYRPFRSQLPTPAMSGRARTTSSGSRAGHALAAFFLLVSLLAPLTLAMPVGAAPQPGPQRDLSANARRDGAPPPLPTPVQVVVSGEFGDIELADSDSDGTWDGFFQLPPGSYDYRIVHVSDEQRSLGENGDPDGDDLELDVPDDAIAVYFAYNTLTGAIAGNPMANDVQLGTDLGTFQMAPTNGDFEVYFDHPGGSINVQVIVDGQPGEPTTVDSDTGGRAHVVADDSGNLTDADVVELATLTVQKTDQDGNPLPGSCFALYDGNDVLSQDCDFNDGSDDGTTVLRFPNGAPDGENDLAETFTPDGLDTYGVRLTAGRFFDARERADSKPVVVIDSKMATAIWPHDDPLNRTLTLYPGKSWAYTATVIGVIEPLQLDGALEKSLPGLLMPLQQTAGQSPLHAMRLAVRTHADAATYAQRLAEVVRSVDPAAAVTAVYSQAHTMAMSRVNLMVLTEIFSALGLVALLLAAAGLYGVLAFSVAQRTREIGIRRAIGADNAAIMREVGRQLSRQLGIGLVIGIVLAWPWSQLLADPGLHTHAHDPAVFVPVLLLVVGVALLAALVPLYRALRIDPAIALRYE